MSDQNRSLSKANDDQRHKKWKQFLNDRQRETEDEEFQEELEESSDSKKHQKIIFQPQGSVGSGQNSLGAGDNPALPVVIGRVNDPNIAGQVKKLAKLRRSGSIKSR